MRYSIVKSVIALFFSLVLAGQSLAMAEDGVSSTSQAASQPGPVNLDLTSTDRSISANSYQGLSSAVIQVGQTSRTVTATDFLTPAESVALQQVLSAGQQLLLLGDQGNAVGGTFNLTSSIGQSSLAGLVVPTGVTAIADFGIASNLNLLGNLTNAGNFYAVSSNASVSSANISALNIINQQGLISSILPAGGITGYNNLLGSLNLNLSAINNIINSGSIMSSGNLTAIAGGSIINALPAGLTGISPVMQAANNLNLQAMNIVNSGTLTANLGMVNLVTANLNNAGLIQSLLGNIAVVNSLQPNLGLNVAQSSSAIMEALQGSIDFNVVNAALKQEMNISGGSLLAQELNFNNGDGNLAVNLRDAFGAINVETGIASFAVTEGTHGLNIQTFNITGDPNLVYSGSGPFSSGAFNSLGGFVDINTSTDTVNGSITFTGNINTTPSSSGTGGFVRLNAGTFISTQNIITSANTSGNAGEILLTARGNITVVDVTANGAGAGNGPASMKFIAGTSGTGNVSIGNITAAGTSTSFSELTLGAAGTITGGTITANTNLAAIASGNIQLSGINLSSSTIAGGVMTLASTAGNITITTSGINTSTTAAGLAGGGFTLSAAGDINVTGALNSSCTNGGMAGGITVQANNFTMLTGDIAATSIGTTGSGNNLFIQTAGNITIRNVDLDSGTAGGAGAAIVLNAGGSGTGNITTLDITHGGVLGTGFSAITAPGTITMGNYTSVSGTCCAWTQIVAGSGGGGAAPAQGGTLTIGNINMANTTIGGGSILITNMATNGAVQTGSINLRSPGANTYGGSLNITAHGTVTVNGNIDARGNALPGGGVFLSSGQTSGTVVTVTGSILLNGSGGGLLWVARHAGTTSSIGSIAGSGGTFNGTPTGSVANVVGNQTITIGSGTLTGFYPGGFDSINAPAGVITVTRGTVTRGIVSVIARTGDVALSGYAGSGTSGIGYDRLYAAGNITVTGSIAGVGGSFGFMTAISSGGTLTVNNITVGTAVDAILFLVGGQGITLVNGGSIVNSTSSGFGGFLTMYSAGVINLGTSGNVANNAVNASGTSAGGAIIVSARTGIVDYGVTLNASTTAGTGGSISLLSGIGGIELYNAYNGSINRNASLLVNSGNGAGGSISIYSAGLTIARDPAVCCGGTTTGTIRTSGTTSSGAVLISNYYGNINISDPISINAAGGTAGAVTIYNYGSISSAASVNGGNILVVTTDPTSTNSLTGIVTSSTSITLNTRAPITVGANMTATGGLISLTSSAITISPGVAIQAQTVNLLANSFDNSGTVTATTTGSTLTLNPMLGSAGGDMTLLGNGSYSITGAGPNTLTLSVTGGTLTFSGSNTFNPGASGIVNFNAVGSTDAIVFNTGTTTITAANGTVTIASPSITFANNGNISTNLASGRMLSIGSGGANPLTITGPGVGNTAAISTAGGNIILAPNTGQALTFSGNGTFDFNTSGGSFFAYTSGVGTTVAAGIILDFDTSATFTVDNSTFANNGTISVIGASSPGVLTIQSTVGNLTINPTGTIAARQSGTGHGGAINILANNGTLTMQSGTLSVNGSGAGNANGGQINILAQALTVSGGSLSLAANAANGGNGGTIVVQTSKYDADLSVGSGQLSLSARGGSSGSSTGNGGTIILRAGRDITVDGSFVNVTPAGNNGTGGSITLFSGAMAGGSIAVTNGLNANGVGNGAGGLISVTSSQLIDLAGASYTANAGNTSGSGGAINLTAQALRLSGSAVVALSANASGTNSGGSIAIAMSGSINNDVSSLTYNFSSPYGISIGTAVGQVSLSATGGSSGSAAGNGGSISVLSGGGISLNAAAINVSPLGNNGNGGIVSLNCNTSTVTNNSGGNLDVVAGSALSVSGAGTGSAGSITLRAGLDGLGASTIIFRTAFTISANGGTSGGSGGNISIGSSNGMQAISTLAIQADAGGTGNGGSVTIQNLASGGGSIPDIGSGAGLMSVFARGGSVASASGNGGSISINTSGTLAIDSAFLGMAPRGSNGNGGSISLTAPLVITGGLDAGGVGSGNGGSIVLSMASSVALTFTIGAVAGSSYISGNLNANAGATGTSAGSISVTMNGQANSAITLNAWSNLSASAAAGNGGSVSLNVTPSGGILTVPVGSYGINGGTGNRNGGSVFLSSSVIALGGSGSLSLTANASGTGNGGSLSFITTGNTASSDIALGAGIGQIQLTARGGSAASAAGNGGSVTVSSGRNLTVAAGSYNVSPLGNNGNGGIINFGSGSSGNLLINGGIAANGVGTGNGGAITLTNNSTTAFNIGAATTNGITAGTNSANAGTAGNGGSFIVNNSGTGGITLAANTPTVSATGAAGAGGTISLNASNASGVLTIAIASLSANAIGSANGGQIALNSGGAMTVTAGVALVLTANAAGTGNGGTITVSSGGALTIANTANNLNLSARGGSASSAAGNGGTISVTSNTGNLTVTPAVLLTGPLGNNGNGGNIVLAANNGNVVVSAALAANGVGAGNGGSISITSNSVTTFNTNAAGTNGITGGLDANAGNTSGKGGSISITNNGSGGITIPNASNFSATGSSGGGAGGSFSMITAGVLSIRGGAYNVSASGGNNNGGTITIQAASLTSTGGGEAILTADATGTGNGGIVSVVTTSAAYTIVLGTNNLQITVSAQGGSAASVAGNGGTILLQSAGGLTYSAGTFAAGPRGNNGNGANITLQGTNIDWLGVSADGVGTGNGGSVNIISNSATVFTVGGGATNRTTGAVTANSGLAGTGSAGSVSITNNGIGGITLSAISSVSALTQSASGGNGGGLTLNASTGTLTIPTGTFNLNATGSGNANGGSISLQAGTVTVTGGALTLSANGASSGNGGGISITTTGAASAITIGAAVGNFILSATGGSAGSLSGDGGSVSLSAGAALTVNTASISVGPLGTNGQGANFALTAGTAAAANLQVAGNLISDGVGTGNGGSIAINYRSASAFIVANTVANSGISGYISAAARGTGNGGSITIANNAAALTIQYSGLIDAGAVTGAAGTLNFIQAGQAVSVTAGSTQGNLIGNINGSGSSITVSSTIANGALNFTSLLASNGAISVGTDLASSSRVVFNASTANNFRISGGSSGVAFGISTSNFMTDTDVFNNSVTGAGFNLTGGASGLNLSSTNYVWFRAGLAPGGGFYSITSSAAIAVSGGWRFDLSTTGTFTMSSGSASSITLNRGALLFPASGNQDLAINITTPNLILGANSTIASNANINGTNAITISAPTGSDLVFTAPDGATGVISAAPSGINNVNIRFLLDAGRNLTFAKTAGVGSGTLRIYNSGTTVNTTASVSAGGVATINNGVIVSADYGLNLTSNGSLFVNNGTLMHGGVASGNILLQGTNGFGISGSGTYSLQSTSLFTIQLNGAGTLNFTSSLALSSGSSIILNAQSTSGAISLANGVSISETGTAAITISTPSLTLGTGASITSSGASVISLNSGGGAAGLTITSPNASSATISTTGGTISVSPTAGQGLTFAKSAGGGVTTLNLNGGMVTLATSGTSTMAINGSVTVASNNNIIANADGGTFNNSGILTTSNINGSLIIRSQVGALSYGGTGGLVSITGGGTETMTISASGATDLTLNNTHTFNAGAGGDVTIRNNAASARVVIAASANIQVDGDGVLTINTRTLSLGNASFVRNISSSSSNISITSSADLTISGPSGNSATVITNGGTITISPTVGSVLNFSKSGATATTVNFNGGALTTTTTVATTIDSSVTVASNNNITMNVNGSTLTNNGLLTSSRADGNLIVASSSSLLMAGSGTFSVTGGGANAQVSVSASGSNVLTLDGDLSFDSGSSGIVILQAASAGGSIVVGAARSITIPNSWALEVIAPTLTLNNTSQIRATGSGQYIELASGSLAMTINLPGGAGQSATVQNTNGYILVGPYDSGVNLSFNAAAASTLNLNAQSVQTWAINGTTTVAANATVASTGNITMNADGGSIQVLGTLQSTLNGGYITFQGWGSNLTMSGTPGTVRFTGGAVGTISLVTQGLGNTINLNSGYTFNPGTNGQVLISSSNINIANSTTVTATSTSTLSITTNNLTIGSGSTLTTNKTTGTALTISALNNSSALTITGTTGSTTGAISTSGGDILTTSNALTFAQTGAGTTTINLNTGSGGTVYTNTNTGNTTINSGVTVSMNGNLDMQVWGGGSLVNNGTITSTKNAGSLLITGNANFTMSGTGTYSVSGTGVNTISIIAYGANFNINNNTTLNAGASGIINVGSSNQNITLGNNVTVQSTNGSLMNIQASSLTFGNSAVISTTKSSGVGINVYSGSNQPLTITAPSGSSGTISTDGGTINIYSDGAMTYAKSAAGNTTLNLGDANSGAVTITSWNTTTINSGVNVLAAKDMTFNVQRATINSSGQLNTTTGNITLTAQTGTLSIGANAVIYANEGNLVIQNVDTVGGSISFGSAANIDAFTISNPTAGNVTVFIGGSAGSPVVGSAPANVTVNQSGGGLVYFGTNGITASGPTNTLTAKGRNVQFSTGSGPSTLISLGGSVTIDADPPDPIDVPAVSSTASFANFANFSMPSYTVSNGALSARDLNNGSSADRATVLTINGTMQPASLSTSFNAEALNTIDTDEVLISVPNGAISPSLFNTTKKQDASIPDTSLKEDQADNETALLPISFASSAASGSLDAIMPKSQRNAQPIGIQDAHLDLHTIETEGAVIKCNGSSRVALRKDGSLVLKEGEILISADEQTNLHCNNINIAVKPGSLVLVSKQDQVTKLYNLCEDKIGSTQITVEGRNIELAVGQEVAIGPDHTTIASLVSKDNIGRRNLKYSEISRTHTFMRSEVSLLSLMHNNNSVLPVLMKSTAGQDYGMRNKLVKMAAVLMTVTAGHGAYTAKP